MKLVKRSSFGWGASKADYANPRNGLAVHYDGSNQRLAGKSHSACVTYWKNTRIFHMGPSRKWADIGYSYAVCPHGYVFEGRGLNKAQAAQPTGNTTWYSCTFMSGPTETPTALQINAFRELRAYLRSTKSVAAALKPHSAFISTSCCGNILRKLITNGTLAGTPSKEDDDMPLTAADAELVRKAVVDGDKLKAPPGASDVKGNPTWTLGNVARETYGRTVEIKALVEAQSVVISELAKALANVADFDPDAFTNAVVDKLDDLVLSVNASTSQEGT